MPTPAEALALGILAVVAVVLAYALRVALASPAPRVRQTTGGDDEAEPFAEIVDRLGDPILIARLSEAGDSPARRFTFANAAARKLLRIQRAEGPLATAVRAPEVLAAIDEALLEGRTGHALYQPGGVQDRVWRVKADPLENDSEAALVIFRDETELRRSERTRADFLANASHELRTPLASLAGFVETLRGHARDDPEARERFLAIMHVQAERMRRLVDDLMSLSRIELGEHIPPTGEVDLALAAVDVADALGPLAEQRGVAIRHEAPGAGAVRIVGDRDQILQVAQNLIENALKYTPAGGAVSVEVRGGLSATECAAATSPTAAHRSLLRPDHVAGRRYAALAVRDQGPGIARINLPRLTERFYRVEGQKSGEYAGTGLGLAIVKHIVNRHRGGLTVESAEGHGAIFTAYFPELSESAQGERQRPDMA